jgi:hypothetical protein
MHSRLPFHADLNGVLQHMQLRVFAASLTGTRGDRACDIRFHRV